MKSLENKSVLFLALSGIGNLVMQLPTIQALKDAHPDWNITVWVAPRGTKDIARVQPYIDDVMEMPIQTNPLQHLKNIKLLRQRHFDIGIVLSPGQLLKSAAYLFLSGVPVRIGHSYPLKTNQHSKLFLTDSCDEKPVLHDIEQNIQLLSLLGLTPKKVENYFLTVPRPNEEQADALLTSLIGNIPGRILVGIHAGSAPGFKWKRWPIERFAKLAQELYRKNPQTIFLIFGDSKEEKDKESLCTLINAGNVKPIAFQIFAPILTTAAIIKNCSLFISNDSGLMHISAAVGVPTIGLFGATDERQTGPRGLYSTSLRAHGTKPAYNTEYAYSLGNSSHQSMLAITPDMVIDEIGTFVL